MKRRKRKVRRNPSTTRTVVSAVVGTIALGVIDHSIALTQQCKFTNLNDDALFAKELEKCQKVASVRGVLESAALFGAGYLAGGKEAGTIGRGLMWAAGINGAFVLVRALSSSAVRSPAPQLVTSATPAGTVTTTRANAPDANVPISFEV